MKQKRQRREQGFSFIETMVAMSIFLFILIPVYNMIVYFGNATKTEQARMAIQQDNRYITTVFAEELKDAGSVLTLSHTGAFLASEAYFNGIYPLNSTLAPDGIIVATGDPEAVTKLTSSFGAASNTLNVNSTLVPDSVTDPVDSPPWQAGDKGIVIGTDGYYIFSVASVDSSSITTRALPVYYSAQLLSGLYYDTSLSGQTGKDVTYAAGSPVIRLSNFAIYLFEEDVNTKIGSKIRRLIKVTDTKGVIDVLGATYTDVEKSIISENIWDMQISYVAYTDFSTANRSTVPENAHYYFAGGTSSASNIDLIADLRARRLKEIRVSLVTITDQYGGMRGKDYVQPKLPVLGDRTEADTLSAKGKFGVKISSFTVEPRNFNIIL